MATLHHAASRTSKGPRSVVAQEEIQILGVSIIPWRQAVKIPELSSTAHVAKLRDDLCTLYDMPSGLLPRHTYGEEGRYSLSCYVHAITERPQQPSLSGRQPAW